jgi:hypothetical protein
MSALPRLTDIVSTADHVRFVQPDVTVADCLPFRSPSPVNVFRGSVLPSAVAGDVDAIRILFRIGRDFPQNCQGRGYTRAILCHVPNGLIRARRRKGETE